MLIDHEMDKHYNRKRQEVFRSSNSTVAHNCVYSKALHCRQRMAETEETIPTKKKYSGPRFSRVQSSFVVVSISKLTDKRDAKTLKQRADEHGGLLS